jgi:hypothetical protein
VKPLDKAFWTCRGTFGKTWRLTPRAVYWIYTAVVRPIITYAATIWWPRVKLKTSQAKNSLLRNYGSNENSSNSCNGNPTRTAPTASADGRRGQAKIWALLLWQF